MDSGEDFFCVLDRLRGGEQDEMLYQYLKEVGENEQSRIFVKDILLNSENDLYYRQICASILGRYGEKYEDISEFFPLLDEEDPNLLTFSSLLIGRKVKHLEQIAKIMDSDFGYSPITSVIDICYQSLPISNIEQEFIDCSIHFLLQVITNEQNPDILENALKVISRIGEYSESEDLMAWVQEVVSAPSAEMLHIQYYALDCIGDENFEVHQVVEMLEPLLFDLAEKAPLDTMPEETISFYSLATKVVAEIQMALEGIPANEDIPNCTELASALCYLCIVHEATVQRLEENFEEAIVLINEGYQLRELASNTLAENGNLIFSMVETIDGFRNESFLHKEAYFYIMRKVFDSQTIREYNLGLPDEHPFSMSSYYASVMQLGFDTNTEDLKELLFGDSPGYAKFILISSLSETEIAYDISYIDVASIIIDMIKEMESENADILAICLKNIIYLHPEKFAESMEQLLEVLFEIYSSFAKTFPDVSTTISMIFGILKNYPQYKEYIITNLTPSIVELLSNDEDYEFGIELAASLVNKELELEPASEFGAIKEALLNTIQTYPVHEFEASLIEMAKSATVYILGGEGDGFAEWIILLLENPEVKNSSFKKFGSAIRYIVVNGDDEMRSHILGALVTRMNQSSVTVSSLVYILFASIAIENPEAALALVEASGIPTENFFNGFASFVGSGNIDENWLDLKILMIGFSHFSEVLIEDGDPVVACAIGGMMRRSLDFNPNRKSYFFMKFDPFLTETGLVEMQQLTFYTEYFIQISGVPDGIKGEVQAEINKIQTQIETKDQIAEELRMKDQELISMFE